jgi:uncharacterized cofD-like protein
MKKIVLIGGGTGTSILLAGLRAFPAHITVVVSPADDGGSTGVLRRELGVMPAGDIRQALVALSRGNAALRDFFSYRFDRGVLSGHTAGNIILAALEKTTGDIQEAIALAGAMLGVRGEILPAALKPATLSATYADGRIVAGEHYIDEPLHPVAAPITALELSPRLAANPRVLEAIKRADAVIFGPGDLYTSILPNLLPRGIVRAIRASKAVKIVITNIMTRPGQTDGFCASDFVRVIGEYLSRGGARCLPDIALINTKKPAARLLLRSQKQGATFVEPDSDVIRAMGVIPVAADMLSSRLYRRVPGDGLTRSMLRHDSRKTAARIRALLSA